MKDITAALLASLFVLFSLASLLMADPAPGRASLLNPQEIAAELELRYALKK